MKLIIVSLLAFTGVMMAMDPDAGPRTSYEAPPQGRADITLTVINDYALTGFSSPRGLDYFDTSGELIMTDFGADEIYSLNPNDGTVTGSVECPPELPDILGVAVIEASPGVFELYANDWGSVMDVWMFLGGTWSYAFANPVTAEPRGMDSDGEGMLWSIDASTRYLARFDSSGGSIISWGLTELPAAYACGLSTFPYEGNIGIVVGGYSYGSFYFYETDGSSMSYIGSVAEPQTSTASYGIAYSSFRDSFFWLYRTGTSNYRITEFSLDIETALTRDSWGGIKASF